MREVEQHAWVPGAFITDTDNCIGAHQMNPSPHATRQEQALLKQWRVAAVRTGMVLHMLIVESQGKAK